MKGKILYGEELNRTWVNLRSDGIALPAVNATSDAVVHAAMRAAQVEDKPIILQVSFGGTTFYSGSISKDVPMSVGIQGAQVFAHQVRNLLDIYPVEIILNSDHCNTEHLGWLDGMLALDKESFAASGFPLFSMHMLDLSVESISDNILASKMYFQHSAELGLHLEVEVGVAGGSEYAAGSGSEGQMYCDPQEVKQMYDSLSEVSQNFLIAATFGNLHGVFSPGVEKLRPEILGEIQALIGGNEKKANLVFHGTSGADQTMVPQAVKHGIVKANIDTDVQWAYWNGVRDYYQKNEAYLQTQIGNPEGADKPNKSYFDPRKWSWAGIESMQARIQEYYKLLSA